VRISDISGPVELHLSVTPGEWQPWSLHTTDQWALQAIVIGRHARAVFEIGTFDGGTTRLLAEALPSDGRVVTLDLPPAAFDATQNPANFSGEEVGRVYQTSHVRERITQLLQDSVAFDAQPFAGQFDLVLVDGAHDYEHGIADTLTALTLVAPGGVIVFDDFQPYWHGLVRGITTAMRGHHLARLEGTSLGVHVHP
jgi:predicted O-methyltransferase YrrM